MAAIVDEAHCRITRLATEGDWLGVRDRLERLEAVSPCNPWVSWDAAFALWRHFHPSSPCWLVEVPCGGPAPAAALWLEASERRHRLQWRILRSLDAMSLGIPPILAPSGCERAAHVGLVAALPAVARATRCSLVMLHRIEGAAGGSLAAQLARAGVAVRAREFTRNQVIRLEQGLERYLSRKLSAKTRRNLATARRNASSRHGSAPRVERVRGARGGDPDAIRRFDDFLKLRAASWQVAGAQARHGVERPPLDAWFAEAVAAWERRGLVDLHLLRLGGVCAGALLVLTRAPRCWVAYSYYDPEHAECSPGLLAFVDSLPDIHADGALHLDLGGEGSTWKNRWATDEEPLVSLEWPLAGAQALLWRLAHALRRRAPFRG